MSAPLRRSARIASKNSSKTVPSVPLKAPSPSTIFMNEIVIDIDEYEELAQTAREATTLIEKLKAQQEQLRFLERRRNLIDYFGPNMLKSLDRLISEFHQEHENYNQQFAAKMANRVRGDKFYHIITDSNFMMGGSIMELIHEQKEIHNLFVSMYKDVMTVFYLLKGQMNKY